MELRVGILDGVDASVEDNLVKVKGEKGELRRKFPPQVGISKIDNSVVISSDGEKRKQKALMGTIKAHIMNMAYGVKNGYGYRMRIVYSHFPMNVKVQGNEVVIDNFLGERHPRKAKILEGVDVDIKGQEVSITGIDIENVSQTAANIELSTRIKRRDLRVFQDGIYITYKDKAKV